MIAQVKTPRQRQRFLNACREKLCLGATMPLALSLFGKSQPGRFFAGPTLALDVGGSTAWLAGHANPDELAGFLNFCGCEAVVLDEAGCPPPTGWKRAKTLSVFGLPPGSCLCPRQTPPSGRASKRTLSLRPEGSGDALPRPPGRQDDFYSELCSKRSRGFARSGRWNGREIVCTVGFYALADGQAYGLRRARPCGARHRRAWLIVRMAKHPLGRGVDAVFLCGPEQVHFYTSSALKLGSMQGTRRSEFWLK